KFWSFENLSSREPGSTVRFRLCYSSRAVIQLRRADDAVVCVLGAVRAGHTQVPLQGGGLQAARSKKAHEMAVRRAPVPEPTADHLCVASAADSVADGTQPLLLHAHLRHSAV
ncbi:unnamed protein product, partial [Ixodes pacificus]